MKPKTLMSKIQKAIDILEDIYSDKDTDQYIKEEIYNIMDQLMDVGMSVEMGEE